MSEGEVHHHLWYRRASSFLILRSDARQVKSKIALLSRFFHRACAASSESAALLLLRRNYRPAARKEGFGPLSSGEVLKEREKKKRALL